MYIKQLDWLIEQMISNDNTNISPSSITIKNCDCVGRCTCNTLCRCNARCACDTQRVFKEDAWKDILFIQQKNVI